MQNILYQAYMDEIYKHASVYAQSGTHRCFNYELWIIVVLT